MIRTRVGKVALTLWIPPDLRRRAKMCALQQDATLNDFVVAAIQARLAEADFTPAEREQLNAEL